MLIPTSCRNRRPRCAFQDPSPDPAEQETTCALC